MKKVVLLFVHKAKTLNALSQKVDRAKTASVLE